MQKEGTTVIFHTIEDIWPTGLGGVHNLVCSSNRLVNTSPFSEHVAEENLNHIATASSENLPHLRIDTHATNMCTYWSERLFYISQTVTG